MGGSGRGVFLLQQQRKQALFLISRPVLETTLADLECIWRFCQSLYTGCSRPTFISPCLLHTFTQHSLWYHICRINLRESHNNAFLRSDTVQKDPVLIN